jgi:hypothetical protein
MAQHTHWCPQHQVDIDCFEETAKWAAHCAVVTQCMMCDHPQVPAAQLYAEQRCRHSTSPERVRAQQAQSRIMQTRRLVMLLQCLAVVRVPTCHNFSRPTPTSTLPITHPPHSFPQQPHPQRVFEPQLFFPCPNNHTHSGFMRAICHNSNSTQIHSMQDNPFVCDTCALYLPHTQGTLKHNQTGGSPPPGNPQKKTNDQGQPQTCLV